MNFTNDDKVRLRAFAFAGMPDGLVWYKNAAKEIERYCAEHGYRFDTFCDVLAITSPRVRVSRNVELTKQFMDDHYYETMGDWLDSLLPATRSALIHWRETGKIRGPKTSAFAAALKGDKQALVIDAWMARALNVPHSKVNGVKALITINDLLYDITADLSIPLRELQACIWCGIIKAHNKVPANIELLPRTWGDDNVG